MLTFYHHIQVVRQSTTRLERRLSWEVCLDEDVYQTQDISDDVCEDTSKNVPKVPSSSSGSMGLEAIQVSG